MTQRFCRSHQPRCGAWTAIVVVVVLSVIFPTASQACGVCVEDKVAVTYDHAVVQRAAAKGDVVVFCELAGPIDRARLLAAARGTPGVRRASVRVSTQPAALSFVVEPKLRSPQTAVDAIQRTVGPGTRLTIVQLLPAKAELAQ